MSVERIGRLGRTIDDIFRSWVHASVGSDEVLKARHSSLIASHLLGGLLSAIVFAGYFGWVGAPGAAASIACLCFVSQIGIALFLSRTGRLEVAHLLAAANLTAQVTIAAALSGGTASFAIAWLILIPLEAALSVDRRMTVLAMLLAVAALCGLHGVTLAGLLPERVALPVDAESLALATYLGAAVYAGALAASVQQIHRGAAREVEAGRELYRLIAENANDLITRHEVGGRITFASLASRALLGIEPDRLKAQGFAGLLAESDRARHLGSLTRCLAEGIPVSEEFLVRRPCPDGTGVNEIWVEMRCQPVAAGPGQGAAGTVIAVTRDITTRKAEAIEIARARDEAERTSRAKTAFLATMSHELRTPLASIIGFAEILHRELLIKAREPKHADYCRMIHQSGEHLLSLVKDLLDVSKIESGKFSVVADPFALDEVAPGAVETLRPLARSKGIELRCEVGNDLPDLLADRRATRQILINLVSNACKFTEAGGTVTVTARVVGSEMEIAVTDTGIGIAPEHVARLGQPFYQVDTRYARDNEGAGLGLSIVRGLVELHQGTLEISSELGRGSRFVVRLPADIAADVEISQPVPKPKPSTTIVDLAEVHRQRQLRARLEAGGEAEPRAAMAASVASAKAG